LWDEVQPEDAVVVFARSCGSVCNKPPTHLFVGVAMGGCEREREREIY